MDMEKRAEEFRAAVRKQAGGGPRNWYTTTLRAQAVRYWEARKEQGASLAQAAQELGIAAKSLRQWSTSASEAPEGFRPVEVVQDEASPARATTALVVHGPGGLRIEGLDVESLALLLRRLG
jgi:transposase